MEDLDSTTPGESVDDEEVKGGSGVGLELRDQGRGTGVGLETTCRVHSITLSEVEEGERKYRVTLLILGSVCSILSTQRSSRP